MSDCKHDWNFWPSNGVFVCHKCNHTMQHKLMADRKEKAEARVKELESVLLEIAQLNRTTFNRFNSHGSITDARVALGLSDEDGDLK